ncbi:MAG: FtsX-like permease family protein [Gallionella sp.]|nr:FtsX-like permease family protein [Gallionella sp.]
MSIFRLSINLLRRDWRAGEWRVLLLALVLAVGSLATVGLFADRVRQALWQQATSLLGADMRITSTRELPPFYREAAEARGLQAVESRTFPSMVAYREQVLLAEIQAVEAGYPLRGKIEIDDGNGGRVRSALSLQPSTSKGEGVVERGTVWADERLMRRLDLRVGEEVSLGAQRFVVAARIVKDIDQTIGFASFAPRVLMNEADLAATGLIQEGSRISYRLMVAGEAAQVVALRGQWLPRLSGNERLEDVTDARPEIRTALERAEHFLGLAALTAAILAGVAMALTARRYVARHLDGCAVMRCMGAQQGQLLRLFLYQFVLVGLLAVLAGSLLGYVTQAILIESIATMREADLPQPGMLPVLKAGASGFALLIGFAFLPLLQLRRVSPLRVLRREMGSPTVSGWLIYGLAILVLAILFLWQAGTLQLGLTVLGGLLSGLLVFGVLAWLMLQGLARHANLFGARHALNNLARHGRSTAVQVVALSLGGMALLLLTLVRGDLLQSWQGKLPADTPNRFVVNIQPDQRQAVLDFVVAQQLPSPQLLPMVKGRLLAINERAINGESYADTRAQGLVEREFNLSYADRMPQWNELVSGRWWSQGENGQLSVEEGIAKTLNIHLGDELTYDVAGSRFSARVTSLRKVQWDSMQVNFFVIGTPGLLQDYPSSYLTSFHLPPDKVRAGDELVRAFPNLLVIDTGAAIAQVRNIIEQVSQTVGVVFLFTLLSGVVVLYAALLSTQDERVHEAAILRTLGADSAYLRRLHLGEFAVLGLLSGLFAAASAALLGWVLAHYILEIPYQSNSLVWLTGMLGGMVLVMLAGWLNTRRLVEMSPMRILRGE